ncbi:MAG: putative Peptidoglycan glycosyltransferase [Candidatus Saccharibacteria bacterium]|nr:putative Peptidoglycan glycosyltransferase [Candidatus Saccharibacteria bacterium]MDB5180976.1 putative Peptidoglycan glycosyltransferase [Candidatus Saccharibacteria bacterium]
MKPAVLRHGSRSRILAAVILGIAAIFVIRLFYLQIIQHNHYVELAQSEQMTRERIPAKRGEIYAMSGESPVKMVLNETVYTVFVDPSVISDYSKVADVMKQVAGGNVRDGFEDLMKKTETRYQVIANKVTRLQADKIKEAGLKGIGFMAVSQRVYPEQSLASQVLGFVDTEGEGKYGLEGFENDELKGVDGRLETVTDVSDVPLTIGDRNVREAAKNGKNIVMSLDRNIQSHTEQALAAGLTRTGATRGSVLVMNPLNGQVLAMANLPTYNPGKYFEVNDAAAFNNGTISEPYEPGSDVKTFTMATGIDKGVVRASDTFNNTDTIKIEDRTIGNATKGHTGVISFQTALTFSLNTGFVTVAQRLGDGRSINRTARDTMYEYFHDRFRLGQLTGIELANEAKGIIISPDDPDGNAVRYSNMSFGQGLDATMVQVSGGFSAMINGGNYFKPTIIAGEMVDGTFKKEVAAQPLQSGVVTQSTSDQMRQMMQTARASSFGRTDKQGYNIGGKTGTSQVIRNGQYSDTETIGTYLGYGGAETPEYVIMVSVSGDNRQLQGARDALPIFTDISNWMIDYLKIQPKG